MSRLLKHEAFFKSVGAGVLLPTQTNLVRWYEADYGVYSDTGLTTPQTTNAGAVKGWADRTGNANASEGTNNPTLQTNGINGKAALLFDSGLGTAPRLSFTLLALTNFTAFIVADASDFAPTVCYPLCGTSQGILLGGTGVVGYGAFDGANLREANAQPTTVGVYVFQNQKLYRNGAEATYNTTGNVTGLTLTTIGTRPDTPQLRFNGLISAILVYNATLSAAQINVTGNYLVDKYGTGAWALT